MKYSYPFFLVVIVSLSCSLVSCTRPSSVTVSTPNLGSHELKLGVVDMSLIFKKYYKTRDAQSQYAKNEADANNNIKDRLAMLKTQMHEISTMNATIDDPNISKEERTKQIKNRELKVALLAKLDREIATYRSAKRKSLQDEFLWMRQDIVKEIMKSLNKIVKTKGYDLVFDKSGMSASAIPIIIYERANFDFTQEVIRELNKNAPEHEAK